MAENVGKRGSGWYYRFDLPTGPDGKRRQRRVSGFRTERDARNALAEATVAVSQQRLRYAPTVTFEDLAREWLSVIGSDRKATTIANYEMLVDAYLIPRIGSLRLDRLTAPRIQHLYVELRASGGRDARPLSGTHVRNIHRVLHNVLAYACRMGYLALNPADAVERPRDDTAERTIYSPEQTRRFLEVAKGGRLGALWYLAISAGLRRAELAGLQWQDVDLEATPAQLWVRASRSLAGSRVVESGPKTKAGRRMLVLDERAVGALTDHRERMEAEADLRADGRPVGYVFVDEVGEPFHPARLTRMLHGLQRKAGLPEITLHDLRHTSATIALLAGVHPKVVAERHGHASTQITLDRYSHVLQPMQVAAAASIGEFLNPIP
ncbi:MAG TPA: tyrosine-type recombinase/integrase [Acidimicrobiales bacterium]|nr:tyrosine-type recombinase/integrase [Acidimicrobiales bacterium]